MQVQCLLIDDVATVKKNKKRIKQYFYVNPNNIVQLIHPNYRDKSEKYLA